MIMDLTIDRTQLVAALAGVQGSIERRNTIPILSNVLLDATEGRLDVLATNLTLQMADSAVANVSRPGQISAEGARLYEIARAMPEGGQISLSYNPSDDHRLVIKCGRSRYLLPVLPADSFPIFGSVGLSRGGALERDALKRLIQLTRFAASHEETRHYICGLFLHGAQVEGAARLRSVATDGHRLALADTEWPAGFSEDWPKLIVPTKTADEMLRMLDAAGDQVELWASDNKIRLIAGSRELTSLIVEGSYPDYARVIPRSNPLMITLDVDLTSAVIARAALVSDGKSRMVRLDLQPGKLTVSARNDSSGQGAEELEIDYSDAPKEFSANSRYLRDVLGKISGESLTLHLAGDADPILITDSADIHCRYVVMPGRA